jgi:hypothetical protein
MRDARVAGMAVEPACPTAPVTAMRRSSDGSTQTNNARRQPNGGSSATANTWRPSDAPTRMDRGSSTSASETGRTDGGINSRASSVSRRSNGTKCTKNRISVVTCVSTRCLVSTSILIMTIDAAQRKSRAANACAGWRVAGATRESVSSKKIQTECAELPTTWRQQWARCSSLPDNSPSARAGIQTPALAYHPSAGSLAPGRHTRREEAP